VQFLFAHGRQWSMSGTQNRFAGKGENFLSIITERIGVRNTAAAHRAREHRIPHHCDWPGQPGDHKSDAADRMAGGLTRLDFEATQLERAPFRKSFCAIHCFKLRDKCSRASRGFQPRQVGDVVRMGVGQENRFDCQVIGLNKIEDRRAICACVKDGGFVCFWISHQVSIHPHVVIRCIKLRQTGNFDEVRLPTLPRALDQRFRAEI